MRGGYLLLFLALTGCVDLSAVTKFSQTAPDVSKLDALTDIYVSDPQTLSDWQGVWTTPDQELAQETATRKSQKQAFDGLHALIVNYMKSLGTLSATNATDISTPAKAVSANLAAVQKARPKQFPLSPTQVTAIGDLITIVPQDLLNIWRGYEVGRLIKQNQAAFHAMIDSEIIIVQQYKLDYHQALADISLAAGRMNAALGPDAGPTARAARFNFNQQAAQATARLNDATTAAQQYVVALQKLGAAYDVLVQNSDHFTSATLTQILPYLGDVEKAYADIPNL